MTCPLCGYAKDCPRHALTQCRSNILAYNNWWRTWEQCRMVLAHVCNALATAARATKKVQRLVGCPEEVYQQERVHTIEQELRKLDPPMPTRADKLPDVTEDVIEAAKDSARRFLIYRVLTGQPWTASRFKASAAGDNRLTAIRLIGEMMQSIAVSRNAITPAATEWINTAADRITKTAELRRRMIIMWKLDDPLDRMVDPRDRTKRGESDATSGATPSPVAPAPSV